MQQESAAGARPDATLLYKVAPAALWAEAERAGSFAGAPVDLADGFVHLSTRAQVAETVRRHFAGQRDLVLAAFDADALGPALRFDVSRGGDRFPHHYGPLPLDALRDRVTLESDAAIEANLPPSDLPSPRLRGWTIRRGRGYIELLGPLWHRPETDGPAFGIVAEARHLNGNGVVHGGCLMSLLDEAAGRASWQVNGERRQATIQLDTQFIAPAREGDFLEARCQVVRQTRSINFLAGALTVGERIVATTSGIWKVAGSRGTGERTGQP